MVVDLSKTCKTCSRVYSKEQDYLSNTSSWRVCTEGNLWFECSCRSTLMVVKGKFSWYSPTKFMSADASSVFNRLTALQKLPHIASSVMKIMELVSKSDVEPSVLARELRKEPLFAEEILRVADRLRLARSPGEKPFKSIEHAVTYVGINEIKPILTVAGLKTLKIKTKKFTEDFFWNEALTTGEIAERLACDVLKLKDADDYFLAASLMNIGKIVGAICLPEEADTLIDVLENRKLTGPWRKIEKNHLLTSHVILGEIGAAFWGLSDLAREAIKFHHADLATIKARGKQFPQHFYGIMILANQLTHWVLLQPERIDPQELDAALAILKLTVKEVEALASRFARPSV